MEGLRFYQFRSLWFWDQKCTSLFWTTFHIRFEWNSITAFAFHDSESDLPSNVCKKLLAGIRIYPVRIGILILKSDPSTSTNFLSNPSSLHNQDRVSKQGCRNAWFLQFSYYNFRHLFSKLRLFFNPCQTVNRQPHKMSVSSKQWPLQENCLCSTSPNP